ncbi:MAG: plasmid stabilization protein [Pseudomonadota bacterium]
MPRGEKSKYTGKQKRQARHIEEGYEQRGLGEDEAARRAWGKATKLPNDSPGMARLGFRAKQDSAAKESVNKMTGGGKKAGSGRGKAVSKAPAKKGGGKGGAASAARPAAARSAAARKAAETRRARSGASAAR